LLDLANGVLLDWFWLLVLVVLDTNKLYPAHTMKNVDMHDFFLIPLTQMNSVAIYVRSETLYNKEELQLSNVPPIPASTFGTTSE
jgi:hypothetical protein